MQKFALSEFALGEDLVYILKSLCFVVIGLCAHPILAVGSSLIGNLYFCYGPHDKINGSSACHGAVLVKY